jgi:hypothetical protein
VEFTLSQPIVCDSNEERVCQVAVPITNSHPNLVAIEPCVVVWTSQTWFQKRTVRVTAVENYVNDNVQRTVTLKTEPAISSAVFYEGFDPKDITITSPPRHSAQCRATGDPHYTTFDSATWLYYDGNSRPRTVVHLVKSTQAERPFGHLVVQTQVRGNPAVNCAIAGREGNNLVIIDVCHGRLILTTKFGTPKAEQPEIQVTGASYTVYFKSGFWMRADTGGWGANVYVQAPGIDFNAVCGVCGNFDGNRNNDFLDYSTMTYGRLNSCQQVNLATEDLWAWNPEPYVPRRPRYRRALPPVTTRSRLSSSPSSTTPTARM